MATGARHFRVRGWAGLGTAAASATHRPWHTDREHLDAVRALHAGITSWLGVPGHALMPAGLLV